MSSPNDHVTRLNEELEFARDALRRANRAELLVMQAMDSIREENDSAMDGPLTAAWEALVTQYHSLIVLTSHHYPRIIDECECALSELEMEGYESAIAALERDDYEPVE